MGDPTTREEFVESDADEVDFEHRRAEREAWEEDRMESDDGYAGSWERAYEAAVERSGP